MKKGYRSNGSWVATGLIMVCSALGFPHYGATPIWAGTVTSDSHDLSSMSLEDLMNVKVVSATLKEQSIADAPAPMYVVTAQDIAERGYHTLKDVMNDVPGYLDLSDSNENIAGVRGVYASTTNKILIMINGHRMNSLSLGRYNTDQFIGLDTVERIEFIMGPGSVLYGTGALIGVVNIVLKDGADLDGLLGRISVGTFETEGSVSWGAESNDLEVFGNFTFLDGDGAVIDQPASLDVVPAGETPAPGHVYWNRYLNNWTALMSVRYRTDTKVWLRYGHHSRGTPRVPNGSFYDFQQEADNGFPAVYAQDDFVVDASTVFRFSDGSKLTVNPGFHFINLKEQSWISEYGSNRLPPLGSRSGQNSEEVHWKLKSYYERDLSSSVEAMIGIDVLYADFQKAQGIVLSGGDDIQIIPRRTTLGTWLLFGAFAELSWSPRRNLDVTAGVRIDDFEDQADSRVTPRVGLVYTPSQDLTIKALYGESYLSPQWEHKNMDSETFAFASNPDLEPETLRSGDLVVNYHKSKASVWVDLFINDIDGIITSDQTGTGKQTYVNYGASRYWGSEAGLDCDILESMRISAAYSFVDDTGDSDPQFLQNGRILNVPRHVLRYGVRYQALSRLVFNLWGRTYSEVQTSDSITGAETIDPWTRLDLTGTYVFEPFELRAKVVNIADEAYEVGGTVVRPLGRYGRGYELALKVGF